MARPVNADAAATRQRILQRALALFATRGRAGSSIRHIASEAGVSLAMVHHYFGNKDGLYEACIDLMYSEFAIEWPRIASGFAEQPDFGTALQEVIEQGMELGWRHRLSMRLLLRSVVTDGGLDDERRRRYQEPVLERLCEALASRLGGAPSDFRLPLQSLTFLVSRYAVSSDDELLFLTQVTELEEAQLAIKRHLFRASVAMLTPHTPA